MERDPVDPVVELRAAHKRYRDVDALHGVDLTIARGEVVALLGPNGAGKTTTISLMLGLRRPTSGEALLFGRRPTDRRARSRCGVVLQESGVTGVLRVREIVDLFRSYYPSPLSADEAIGRAGLSEQAASPIARLSGGQRQRLYFALAICGDPELLFLDEPTVGMDVEARHAFLASLKAFATAGKTIVLTTHYLEEADQLATRIVVIDRGILVADATPREMKSRVAGKRVNFRIEGRLTDGDVRGLPVLSLDVAGSHVRLLTNEPELILQTLFARGVRVSELEVVGSSLEEALLGLMSRRAGA